jgi:hypothetical protein
MAATNVQAFSGDVEISSNLAVDTNTLFVNSVGNKVGIGTTDPTGFEVYNKPINQTYRDDFTNIHVNNKYQIDGRDGAAPNTLSQRYGVRAADNAGDNPEFGELIIGAHADQNYTISDGTFLSFNDSGHFYIATHPTANYGEDVTLGPNQTYPYIGTNTDNRISPLFTVRPTGNVGIGTTNPGTALDVNGTVKSTHVSLGSPLNPTIGGYWLTIQNGTFDGNIGDEYPNPEGGILFTNKSSQDSFPWGYYMGVVKDVASTSPTSIRFDIGKSEDLNTNEHTGGTDTLTPYFTIDNGNVGIGTTDPECLLHLSASSSFDPITDPVKIKIHNRTITGNWSITQPWGLLEFDTDDSSGAGSGPVAGIGCRAETASGGDASLCFYTDGDNSDDTALGSANERMCIDHDGNVGIGTANPTQRFVVAKTDNVASTPVMELMVSTAFDNPTPNPSLYRLLDFSTFADSGKRHCSINLLNYNNSGSGQFDITERLKTGLGFSVRNGGSVIENALSISYTGKVGIGTTNPGQTLDVNGDFRCGNFHAIRTGGLAKFATRQVSGSNITNLSDQIRINGFRRAGWVRAHYSAGLAGGNGSLQHSAFIVVGFSVLGDGSIDYDVLSKVQHTTTNVSMSSNSSGYVTLSVNTGSNFGSYVTLYTEWFYDSGIYPTV